MKILLFGEFSGLFNCLKDGLAILGHDVFLASNGDYFKNYPSDYRWDTKSKLAINGKIKNVIEFSNFYTHRHLFTGYDVVMMVTPDLFSGYVLPNKIVFEFLRKHNKKIYLCGSGDMAIGFNYWYGKVGEKYHNYMAGYLHGYKNPYKYKLYKNQSRMDWEMDLLHKLDGYIPIWYEYAQPYRDIPTIKKTIPIPVSLPNFEYKPNLVKDKIVFFHGLSRPSKGGTYILGAFENLKKKYEKEAEFVCAGGLPFAEYSKLLDKTNVVLDDANSYSLGMNALFSMAKGKIVMGGAEPIANQELDYTYNPAYNICPDIKQIEECIVNVIENRSKIEELGFQSRKFVEEYHDYIDIAKKYVQVWEND